MSWPCRRPAGRRRRRSGWPVSRRVDMARFPVARPRVRAGAESTTTLSPWVPAWCPPVGGSTRCSIERSVPSAPAARSRNGSRCCWPATRSSPPTRPASTPTTALVISLASTLFALVGVVVGIIGLVQASRAHRVAKAAAAAADRISEESNGIAREANRVSRPATQRAHVRQPRNDVSEEGEDSDRHLRQPDIQHAHLAVGGDFCPPLVLCHSRLLPHAVTARADGPWAAGRTAPGSAVPI